VDQVSSRQTDYITFCNGFVGVLKAWEDLVILYVAFYGYIAAC
jgi:hypothetical protein